MDSVSLAVTNGHCFQNLGMFILLAITGCDRNLSRVASMTNVEIVLTACILGTGVFAFFSFLRLKRGDSRSVGRLGFWLMIFGVGILFGLSRYQYWLFLTGERATATVLEINRRRGGYQPVVRFFVDGHPCRFACKQRVRQKTYSVGDEVPVYYLAEQPSFAIIATWSSFWQPTLIGTTVALLPILGGAHLYRKRHRF